MRKVDCAYSIEGKGPALFMIHGVGGRRSTWKKISHHLADSFTCISYDLRGHGQSPISGTPFNLEDLVNDLEALRKKLDVEKAHFIGHSLGGMIGPAYTKRYPKRVLSLILLSTAAYRTSDDRKKIMAVSKAIEKKGVEPLVETFIKRWFTDEFILSNPKAVKKRIQDILDTPSEIFKNVFQIYAKTEMSPWLNKIISPSLILTGELDQACNPRLNRMIADKMPNSNLVILENLKHSILIEASDKVVVPVRNFLIRHLKG